MSYTKILNRRGTTANWAEYNPILSAGEIGLDLDKKQIKFGDGQTPWNSLDYGSSTAYQIALANGFEGTEQEWLDSLTGYAIALENGFAGTSAEWLDTLTAYGVAVTNGYEDTVEQWLLDLVGPPASISIGTISTLSPGASATVTLDGSAPNYTINLGIPQGNPGTDIHFVGSVPTVEDLPSGASSNDAYIVDFDGNLWVSNGNDVWTDAGQIVGPQGIQGETGDTGAQGPAATISIGTVTTGEPTDPVVVTNVGTSGAAILDFTIPKGDTGSLGDLSANSPILYSSNTISLDHDSIQFIDGGTA